VIDTDLVQVIAKASAGQTREAWLRMLGVIGEPRNGIGTLLTSLHGLLPVRPKAKQKQQRWQGMEND
jgi:hypothetical protein